MCSIATNATADQQLTSVRAPGDERRIEDKLKEFAGDSNVTHSGVLDLPQRHLKDMPSDLKHIRRIRAGRHRVFYTGYHTHCSYNVCYIKLFKREGEKEEHDSRFRKVLKGVINDPATSRIIRKPDDPNKN